MTIGFVLNQILLVIGGFKIQGHGTSNGVNRAQPLSEGISTQTHLTL